MPRKYGTKASSSVGRAMHKTKRGKLASGRSRRKVKSRKQAIAIGLSEARRKGAKVPPKKTTSARTKRSSTSSRRRTASKSSSSKTSRQRSRKRTNSR